MDLYTGPGGARDCSMYMATSGLMFYISLLVCSRKELRIYASIRRLRQNTEISDVKQHKTKVTFDYMNTCMYVCTGGPPHAI